MAQGDRVPVRRGAQKQLTLDFDAVRLLEELASGPKGQGKLLSELVRAEVSRREERARVRQEQTQAPAEPVGASHE